MFTIIYYTNEKNRAKFQVNDLVRTADLRKIFSKRDKSNCSFEV